MLYSESREAIATGDAHQMPALRYVMTGFFTAKKSEGVYKAFTVSTELCCEPSQAVDV